MDLNIVKVDRKASPDPVAPVDLSAAVKKVTWADLSDNGKGLLIADLAQSYADNAADLFKERFLEHANDNPYETLVDINDGVLDSIVESSDGVPGTTIDKEHAFVLKHLKPKRKASDAAPDGEAKRACP